MRIKMIVEYDGTDFSGFQRQPGLRTVDQVLETAIHKLTGESVRVIGAGRTDAGVHALGQTVAFDTSSSIPPEKFYRALNTCLPEDIRAVASEPATPDFHPSYDCRGKIYRYSIFRTHEGYTLYRRYAHFYPGPLDLELMRQAAELLIGERDFKGFMSQGSPVKDTVRTIFTFEITARGPWLIMEIYGSGFLYRMVRNMAGTLIEIGRGAMKPEIINQIFDTGKRSLGGPTAPARGLCLVKVIY